jgi:hypothetical protein
MVLLYQWTHALVCNAYTPGAPDHPSVLFFQGWCYQAIDYAWQSGGWWRLVT